VSLVELDNELLQNEREDVIKETKEGRYGDGNNDSNNRIGNGLAPSRPRDVSKLGPGVLNVVYESIHVLKNTPSGAF